LALFSDLGRELLHQGRVWLLTTVRQHAGAQLYNHAGDILEQLGTHGPEVANHGEQFKR
jgi:hypothetical protein